MLKIFSKKLLATLVIMVMAVSMLPVGASADGETLSITNYSDLGFDGVTPAYKVDVDNDTAVETKPTSEAEVALPMANQSSGVDTFMSALTRMRKWNHDNGDANVKRVQEAYAKVDSTKTEGGMVAVIKGGNYDAGTPDDTADDTAAASVSRSISVKSGATIETLGNLRAYEIKVKFSNVEDGDYRLFAMHTDYNMSNNNGQNIYVAPVAVNKGSVYVYPDNKYPADDAYGVSQLAKLTDPIATGLQNNKWYTFVKVVKVDATRGSVKSVAKDGTVTYTGTAHLEGKVYVFDDTGACIGGHDDMRDFARLTTTTEKDSREFFKVVGFAGLGLGNGTEVMFDDYKIYALTEPHVEIDVKTVEGSTAGNVGAIFSDGVSVKYATAAQNFFVKKSETNDHTNAKLNVDVYLPSVGGETEEAHVFALAKEKYVNPNHRIFEIHYQAGAEGEAGYTTASICSFDGTDITKTVLKDANNNPIKLEAKKWYTFSCDTSTFDGTYSAKITDRATGEVITTASGTRQAYEPYTADWSGASSCGIVGANGYVGAVLFDNIDIKAVKADGSQSGDAKNYGTEVENFDSAEIGKTIRSMISSNWGVSANMAADANCYVASLDNYLVVGKVMSTTPAPAVLTADFTLGADAEDAIEFTETLSGTALKPTVTPGADGKTLEIDFGELDYGTSYTLKIGALTNSLGFSTTEKTLVLEVTEDPFTISNIKFVDGTDGVTVLDEALAKDETVKASVYLSNEDTKPRDYVIILALYDGQKLEDVTALSDTAAVGFAGTVVSDTALTATKAGLTAQIYVWDSWSTMAPKTDASDVLPETVPEA